MAAKRQTGKKYAKKGKMVKMPPSPFKKKKKKKKNKRRNK